MKIQLLGKTTPGKTNRLASLRDSGQGRTQSGMVLRSNGHHTALKHREAKPSLIVPAFPLPPEPGASNGNGNGHSSRLAYAGSNGAEGLLTNGASPRLKIVVLGLSITSSWGNGHATTYRALLKQLAARGHKILFLERNLRWYAANRDMSKPPYCRVALYNNVKQLKDRHGAAVRDADLVIVGSYVPEGVEVGEWVTRVAGGATAFYDIDTPVTLAKLQSCNLDYLSPGLIGRYTMYLSFTGGPMLDLISRRYGAAMARPLYCSVDETLYYPEHRPLKWDLGYMGTYSDDRQPALEELLLRPARAWSEGSFVVAGPQYPKSVRWPKSVKRFTHLPPKRHRVFYNQQRFTLNITREQMVEAGYSPSVRLFEAAACGTPIISDFWEGLDHFFTPGREILVAGSEETVLRYLLEISEDDRRRIGTAAREKVLARHTAGHRALELENYALDILQLTTN
jgi:spore maturation protein CgeB